METSPSGRATVRYRFANRTERPVELWLALPPAAGQTVLDTLVTPEQAVRARGPGGDGVNELAHCVVAPGDALEARFIVATQRRRLQVRAAADSSVAPLPEVERAAYLRSSALIPVCHEIEDEARRVGAARGVSAADAPALDWARAFFDELLTQRFRYVWPPAERGALAMQRDGRGDCGEFSFLFVAWCRAVGIPARVVLGTWVGERMRAHAWAELFADEVGWVPVDPSMGWVARRRPWQVAIVGPHRPSAFFARDSGDRVAFSLDPDVDPPPGVRAHGDRRGGRAAPHRAPRRADRALGPGHPGGPPPLPPARLSAVRAAAAHGAADDGHVASAGAQPSPRGTQAGRGGSLAAGADRPSRGDRSRRQRGGPASRRRRHRIGVRGGRTTGAGASSARLEPSLKRMTEGERLIIVTVADVPEDRVDAFQEYESRVLPLLGRHGGRLERRLRSMDSLVEVHIVSFKSRDGYESYIADPERMNHRSPLTDMHVGQRVLEVQDV